VQKQSKPDSTMQEELTALPDKETKLAKLAFEYHQASLEWETNLDAQIWERAIGDGIL
jgi:hypothetical protein